MSEGLPNAPQSAERMEKIKEFFEAGKVFTYSNEKGEFDGAGNASYLQSGGRETYKKASEEEDLAWRREAKISGDKDFEEFDSNYSNYLLVSGEYANGRGTNYTSTNEKLIKLEDLPENIKEKIILGENELIEDEWENREE
jgi:hypothetical protein